MTIDWGQLETAEDKSAKAASAETAAKNAGARAYLAETDWHVARLSETGKPIPADIAEARQAARDAVVE